MSVQAFGTVITHPVGGVNCVLSGTPTSNGFNFVDDVSPEDEGAC